MILRVKSLVFALALTLPGIGLAQLESTQPLDSIIAVVDDSVILRSELDGALAGIRSQFRDNPNLPPLDVLERQILERLITTRVQTDRATATGIRISDAEIEQAIQNVAGNSNLSREQLQQALAGDGIDFGTFRNSLREQLLMQRLQQRYVMSRVQVTETEIDLELSKADRLMGEVRLAHIMVGVPDGASPAQIQAAQAKADQVRGEIVGGLEFANAAMRYSDGQQALEGGDLGWRRAEQVPAVFSDVVGSLRVGDVSPVMRGPSGFHMIKLVDKREAQPKLSEEFHTRHIVVKVDEITDVNEAKEKVEALYARVKGGEDFAKVAKEASQDVNTASNGGDMGWFEKATFGAQFEQLISGMSDNDIGAPFRTELGFHIVQRLGARQRDRTAEFEREQARETIRKRRAEEEYENFVRQMRSEAYIENRLVKAVAAETDNG